FASYPQVVGGATGCSPCRSQLLHVRQPFLHIRCLLGKNEGGQKPSRLRAVHCVFSASYCRSNYSCPAIYLSNLDVAATGGDCDSKRNHSCLVRSPEEDGVCRSLRCG